MAVELKLGFPTNSRSVSIFDNFLRESRSRIPVSGSLRQNELSVGFGFVLLRTGDLDTTVSRSLADSEVDADQELPLTLVRFQEVANAFLKVGGPPTGKSELRRDMEEERADFQTTADHESG